MSYWSQMYQRSTPSPRLEVVNGAVRFESLMAKKLSDNDRKFGESLLGQFEKDGTLSEKQIECIEKMEQRYSPETVLKRERWAQSYKSDHRETALIVAKYYRTTTYFSDLSSNILLDEDFVPTERQFAAIARNKYAKKAIATATTPPAYPKGSLCKVRANINLVSARRLHDQFALVMDNHASGLYASSTVLVNGEKVILEDRCLKKAAKSKR
tara:strand:+ start:1883 stop:2518 length:636 start_codon:yes stop_codon:yes gene_type:complete